MPFKSEAQRKKFYLMAEKGEIPKETVKEWQKETGKKKLPRYARLKKHMSGDKE